MHAEILVVDDEENILIAMTYYLRAEGFGVDCARGRQEAEVLLSKKQYAVVVADLRLTPVGGTEGLELLSVARRRYPSTRTILLTAYGSADVEREARQRGVDVVLHKPQALAEVSRVIKGLLSDE